MRPFDLTRDGFVLGEGAGITLVESLEHAMQRGATPLAEIIGGALTADAFHISAPEPTGRGQARSMTNALRHGTGPIEVGLEVFPGRLRLEVTNPLPARRSAVRSGGRGLRGLAERVALLGGTLDVGPHEEQWRLSADIPWKEEP